LRYTPHSWTEGLAAYREACQHGDEGVIAKLANSSYEVGRRSPSWLKFKCVLDLEFVVGGFTDPKGSRVGLGALLVGYYEGRELVYACKSRDRLRRLHPLQPASAALRHGAEQIPIRRQPNPQDGIHWTQPQVVAEVGFTEWTGDGKLRHPRYLGVRTDKDPMEVVREMPR
jgi:ATP-dependent DNA ligase